jgi:hypothetical protein
VKEVKEMGEDADEELIEEVNEGIRFDGIALKSISSKIAKELGKFC